MIERMLGASRLGVVLLTDRVAVAIVRAGRVVDSFSIVDAEHPAATLRAELETRRMKPRVARLGLQRSFVVVKALDLPAAVDGELPQLVRFELERHVPFPADDAAFDFTTLAASREGRRVLVVAAERRTVERALHLADEIKIRPASLTVAAHDLVPHLSRRPRAEHAVWVHRVGGGADLLLTAGNTLVASRYVGAADQASLAAEIRGSLAMLRWGECDALWVSGDGADGLQDWPAIEALGLPIGPPPLSGRARRALGAVVDASDGAALLAAAVATGPKARRLDLLPANLRPRRLTRQQWATIGMGVLTALLGLGALLAEGERDQRRFRRVEAEIRRLDPQVRAVQRVSEQLERERRLLATAEAVAATSLRPLPFLRELTDMLPLDVWLTALTLDQKAAEMTGQAEAASALIPLLENSPRLEHVEFSSPVTRGRDKEQFRIRATWEGPPAADDAPTSAEPPRRASARPANLRHPEAPPERPDSHPAAGRKSAPAEPR